MGTRWRFTAGIWRLGADRSLWLDGLISVDRHLLPDRIGLGSGERHARISTFRRRAQHFAEIGLRRIRSDVYRGPPLGGFLATAARPPPAFDRQCPTARCRLIGPGLPPLTSGSAIAW